MLFRKGLTTLVTSLLLTTSTLSSADDTDIFLSNPNYDSSIKPNVLFILDNSGSMDWSLTYNDDAGYGEDSRLDVMKVAFSDIMSNASDINAGLMKLHSRSGESSRLTFPVTDIDSLYGSNIILAGTPELLESTDDANEDIATGTVTTSSNKLILGIVSNSAMSDQEQTYQLQNYYDSPEGLISDGSIWYDTSYYSFYSTQLNGLYFRDLNIPSNAVIEEARIKFRSRYASSEFVEIKIDAELAKNPQPMGPNQSSYGNRNRTSANTLWSPNDWSEGTNSESDDISNIIQSILDDSSLNWVAGEKLKNLALFMEVTGGTPNDRHIYKEQENNGHNASYAPKLYIKYSVPESTTEKMTGIRFQSVGIPSGSTINSAKIEFTSSENRSGPISLNVYAGKPTGSHNGPFSESHQNLSSREKFGSISWTPSNWTQGTSQNPSKYDVNVTTLLQQVVNDSNWCGNNSSTFYFQKSSGDGNRIAHSIDGNSSKKPRLVVEYTPPADGSGCLTATLNTRINGSDQDAYEWHYDGNMYVQYNEIRLGGNQSTYSSGGLHYPNLPLKKNATILEAYLELTSGADRSGNMNIRIQAEDKDTSSAFTSGYRNITKRNSLTSAYVDWGINQSWSNGTTYRSPDIKNIISEVINRNGWQAGNNLTFILKATGGERYVRSFDRSPSYSPRLIVRVASGGIDSSAGYRVKDHLVSLVQNMSAGGGTPIVPSMYDSAKYYTSSFAGKSSPIINACQTNHLVLLTDGQANSNTDAAKNGIASLTGQSCTADASNDGEKCGRTLADWMATNDLSSSIESDNVVTTHTIAFATQTDQNAKKFMEDLAAEGKGSYFVASDAKELADAFNDIVNSILDNESTFAAPGVAANSFNRSGHLNKLYYSIFKPSETDRWQGNLKKYQLLGDPAEIYDNSSTPKPAVNTSTGFFKEDAFSFWSTSIDGGKVEKGGINDILSVSSSNSSHRKVYTFLGSSPAGVNSGAQILTSTNAVVDTNNSLSPTLFGLSDSQTTERDELINWIRDRSKGIGDPLHSTPALVNYKCKSYSARAPFSCAENQLDLTLFLGTNDGMFHAVNAQTGEELFAFMPKELLPNVRHLNTNGSTNRTPGHGRPYGLDGHLVLWANDVNKNGVIYGGADTADKDNDGNTTEELSKTTPNDGEFVYAYVGMRRGGRNYYALNVTDTGNPKMLWYINGGVAPFQQLGQSWSRPVRTKLKIGADSKDVLIFSGGYDVNQDSQALYSQDSMGNAIYVVDAKTGALIWSASNSSGHTLTLNKMKYSIPGGVTVADIDGDGYGDQLFFADTGGQVWRLYINNCTADSNGSVSTCAVQSLSDKQHLIWAADDDGGGFSDSDDGVIAYIGYSNDMTATQKKINARKFFTRPDISDLALNGKRQLAISIGSGLRPDPLGLLNGDVQDRFYMLVSPKLANPTVDTANRSSKAVPSHTTIKHNVGTLANFTPDSNGNASTAEIAKFGATNNYGWFMNMRNDEKVMSDPAIYSSQIYFNTYIPSAQASNTCSAVAGEAWSWQVNLTGKLVERDEIETNGIVGNSVFVRLASNADGSGTKEDYIIRGLDPEKLNSGSPEGNTYWIQKK